MEIIVGKTAGFCYGVKRAVEGSIEQVKNAGNEIVYCLGEIVHNKQVIYNLEQNGIKFIEDANEINNINSKVIIRAHGIEKNIYDILKNKKVEMMDYTCPNVLKIHKMAEEYERQGFYIFLLGTENHPEIIGTKSYCGKNFSLIKDENDVDIAIQDFVNSKIKKLLVISQTTYSMKKFENIKKLIEENVNNDIELIIKNTICLATEQRQKETKELSSKVDMMLIIGGKNSSNTKKLFEIASENCKNTICIETKDELEKVKFDKILKIGIMAGASTPQKSIDEVINYINR